MQNEILNTKWGKAKIQKSGYYRIISEDKGHYGERLHRLIYESYHGKIPSNYIIHHKDENKLNNHIDNLELMSKPQHRRLHTLKEKNPNYGKPMSDKTKKKLSESKTKNYARIIKGAKRSKPQYRVVKKGKILKTSIDPYYLINWYLKNHPLEIISTKIPVEAS